MQLSISQEAEGLLQAALASGRYTSADEVLTEALRALSLQNDLEKFERLREDIHTGFHQLQRGEGIPLDMDKIETRARQKMTDRIR